MDARSPDPAEHLPLTPAVLHILLAVADEERHGYAIAQEVEELSEGSVRMGPGTLYGTIQRMIGSGLIAEVTTLRDGARRFYRPTTIGRRALRLELERLARVVRHAELHRLLPRAEES